MQQNKPELLERMRRMLCCEYISSLPYLARSRPERVAEALRLISAEDHPLNQWNDALEYLLQLPAAATADQARAALIAKLTDTTG